MRYSVFMALLALFLCVANAHAQTADELAAAKATYIEGLRLLPENANTQAKGFRFAYVEKTTKPGGGKYQCDALNSAQAAEAGQVVEVAFDSLPQQAWNEIDLKYVLLCSEAKAGGRVIGGIPVPPLHLLMLDTSSSPKTASRLPYIALHELFHLIEMQKGRYNDSQWTRLFSGYDNSYGSTAGMTLLGSGGVGFINGYAKSFPHEERAEIFAIHQLDKQMLTAYITSKNDALLKQKLEMMVRKCAVMLGKGSCD